MIDIKRVATDQVNTLQKISRKTFQDTFGSNNTGSDMEAYLDHAYGREQLLGELTEPNSLFYFAYQNAEVVGYLKLNIDEVQTEKIGPASLEIERIYVLPEYKRQGIGSQLYQVALEAAEKKQKSKIWLGVWENNEPALKFYCKLGFKQIGDHVFQLGSDAQRDLIMQKELF